MQGSTTQLSDLILGALQGMAVGDALARPSFGMDWRAIQAQFGKIRGFVDPADPASPPAGKLTDLALLAVGLAGRIGSDGRKPMPRHLIDELLSLASLDSLPAQAAVARIRAGVEPSRSAVPELAGADALYLAVPVGIAHIGDPEGAFLAGRVIAGPILLGSSLEAGQVFAAAIASALMPGTTALAAVECALGIAPPSVGRVLEPACLLAREHSAHPFGILAPVLHDRFAPRTSDPHAPVIEALAIGMISCAMSDGLPEGAILGAANYGGWSSACAAVAGALSGALSGSRAIRSDWVRQVGAQNPGTDLAAVANGLSRLVQLEHARLRARLEAVESMASAHV